MFAVLGFLHALKDGNGHPHEVFRVFGQPTVLPEMRAAGVRGGIIDLVNGLDELEVLSGDAWDDAVAQEIEACGQLLATLGAPDPESDKPLMHLFASPANEWRLRESIAQLDAGQAIERELIEL